MLYENIDWKSFCVFTLYGIYRDSYWNNSFIRLHRIGAIIVNAINLILIGRKLSNFK